MKIGTLVKLILIISIFLIPILNLSAQEKEKKFEFCIFYGNANPHLDNKSNYYRQWELGSYLTITESTDIKVHNEDSTLFFQGFFSFYILPNFGLQVGFGSFRQPLNIDATFSFSFEGYEKAAFWTGEGNLSVVPFSLNLCGKYQQGNFGFYASGGSTLFLNNFDASSSVGFGKGVYSYDGWYYVFWIDAFEIPVKIEETSWIAIGANIGAGCEYKIATFLALVVDARYYLCPKKEFEWVWQPGTYTSFYYEIFANYSLTQDIFNKDRVDELIDLLTVNPSFVQLSIGIKIFF